MYRTFSKTWLLHLSDAVASALTRFLFNPFFSTKPIRFRDFQICRMKWSSCIFDSEEIVNYGTAFLQKIFMLVIAVEIEKFIGKKSYFKVELFKKNIGCHLKIKSHWKSTSICFQKMIKICKRLKLFIFISSIIHLSSILQLNLNK